MDKAFRLIEELLTSLKTAHQGINKEIDALVNSGFGDEELYDLKKAVDLLLRHNILLQNFLYMTLSDEWDSRVSRESILKQKLFLVLKRVDQSDERNIMDWFIETLEEKFK